MTFKDAHEVFKNWRGHLGTFLTLTIAKYPVACFTHGKIEFDDLDDLQRWFETERANQAMAKEIKI